MCPGQAGGILTAPSSPLAVCTVELNPVLISTECDEAFDGQCESNSVSYILEKDFNIIRMLGIKESEPEIRL